jgi:hypothetical protein
MRFEWCRESLKNCCFANKCQHYRNWRAHQQPAWSAALVARVHRPPSDRKASSSENQAIVQREGERHFALRTGSSRPHVMTVREPKMTEWTGEGSSNVLHPPTKFEPPFSSQTPPASCRTQRYLQFKKESILPTTPNYCEQRLHQRPRRASWPVVSPRQIFC